MKFRKGFVTNSSSSSFLLAFKSEKAYQQFYDECDWSNYMEIYEMVNDFIKRDKRTAEEKEQSALEFVENVMIGYDLREWLDKQTEDISDFREKLNKQKELKETHEYKRLHDELLHQEEVQKTLRKVRKAEILCQGTVWDTSGGVMEWSIRNGFLEREFPQYVILVHNVG